jgi:hypothetical protein
MKFEKVILEIFCKESFSKHLRSWTFCEHEQDEITDEEEYLDTFRVELPMCDHLR